MEECAICLDSNTNYITACNHHFHKKCIEEWYKIKPICPLCRTCHIREFTHRYWLVNIRRGFLQITNNSLIISYRFFKKNKVINFRNIHYVFVGRKYIHFIISNDKHIFINTRKGTYILSSLKYFMRKNLLNSRF